MAVTAGFDVGGTELKYGLLDAQGNVLHGGRRSTPDTRVGFLSGFASAWEELKARSPQPIRAAGIGLPGIFDGPRKRLLRSPHCGSLEEMDLDAAFGPILGAPCVVDNDANMAAYGEWAFGAGRNSASLVVLTIGTGIGSGLILDGRLWTGSRGYAGEVGHVTVRPDGRPCRCGNRGCLETEVSAPAIVRRYRSLRGPDAAETADEIARRAESGEPEARQAFADAGHFLGVGLGLILNMLNPEKILIGGGVMAAGDILLGPAVAEAGRHSYTAALAACAIGRTGLGNDSGWIGAAARAARQDESFHGENA